MLCPGGKMDTYLLYGIAGVLLLVSALKSREKTKKALKKGLKSFENILPQFLFVILLVGLLLAVLDPDAISRIIGEESGAFGVLAASVVGAITLIPGFVAFATASQLLSSGAGIVQIAVFVSTLMMVGIATLPMEIRCFGKKTALLRNAFAYVFSFLAAIIIGMAVKV
jgi:Predicted permease.